MPTKTAETVHGSVEYETVECASCGNGVKKDDTSYFVVFDRIEKSEEGTIAHGVHSRGYACDFCRDDPAGYPEGEAPDVEIKDTTVGTAAMLIGFLMMMGALLL